MCTSECVSIRGCALHVRFRLCVHTCMHIHTYTHVFLHVYVCVCLRVVCVCLCDSIKTSRIFRSNLLHFLTFSSNSNDQRLFNYVIKTQSDTNFN